MIAMDRDISVDTGEVDFRHRSKKGVYLVEERLHLCQVIFETGYPHVGIMGS